MIELDDTVQVMWFVFFPPHNDFMAVVQRIDDTRGRLTYRFRYSDSDEPFDDNDVKSWYRLTGPTDELISRMRMVTQAMAEGAMVERWELERGTATLDQFTEQLMALPFIHTKNVKPD